MGKENNLERQQVVLAALLHDIGKFWQRADSVLSESEHIRSLYNKNTYDLTVPLYDSGHPKYAHALWTSAFFSKTKTAGRLKLNTDDDTLSKIAANHHKPNNHLESIVAVADRWSSGIDRPDEGEEGVSGYKEVRDKFGSPFIKKVGMYSIFDSINRSYEEIEQHHTFSLTPLGINNDIFPAQERIVDQQEDYKKLWSDFYNEYTNLINAKEDFDAFYTSLLTLLKKFTWSIPSATNLLPANVSLYEHLKSTAAIALSLYDYCQDRNIELRTDHNNRIVNYPEQDCLLMVCIDVSGIQKFIYDISSKKAAASLKGRSFFLEILMQGVVSKVLNHKSIAGYYSNIIYSSGGKSYLILPNTQEVEGALSTVQDEVSEELWKETNGSLFIAIGHTSFRYKSYFGEIQNGKLAGRQGYINKLHTEEYEIVERYKEVDNPEFNLSMLWRSVSDKAASKKNVRFKSAFLNDFDSLFHEGEDFKEGTVNCAVTGEKVENRYFLDQDKEIPVAKNVYDQVSIGRDLRQAEVVVYNNNGKYSAYGMGQRFSLRGRKDQYVPADQEIYLNSWPNFKLKTGQRHLFYGGNYQPSKLNGSARSKTFEELCEVTKDKNGETVNTKLAVLRMDVDNLGQIFIKGLPEPSFAAYATLSMMLETFFSGYINTIQQESDNFKEHIQIIYSGGDDIFAVGRWDTIVDFAEAVRMKFAEFVKREDISISAGISVVYAKYPIYKAADEAAEAEKQAKKFTSELEDIPDKNAICFLGEVVSWKREWPMVKKLKDKFLTYATNHHTSLLHNIQSYKIRKDAKVDLSYVWQSGYQLTRTMERLKKDQSAEDFVKELRDNILQNEDFGSDRYLDLAAVAARWAELLYKIDKNTGHEF